MLRLVHPSARSQRTIALVAAVGAFALYFMPLLLLGQDAYVTIHDNLDGEFVTRYLLVLSGQAFNTAPDAVLPNVMNGLPRSALYSALSVPTLVFYVFEPHWAYIVNFIIVHSIAFIGMLVLAKRYFLRGESSHLLAVLLAISFLLVPFYTVYGISVAGQPLLLFAFLNIQEGRQRWYDYLVIALFPLYSSIVLVAPFIVAFLGLVFAIDAIRSRRANLQFLGAIALLCIAYLLVEYQMVVSTLRETFVSHRSTWDRWHDFDLASDVRNTVNMLLKTHYHTGAFSTLAIIAAALLAGGILVVKNERSGELVFLAVSIVAICAVYGFYSWIVYPLSGSIRLLKVFNGSRFYFLLPMMWILLFAVSLRIIGSVPRLAPVTLAFVAYQILVTVYSDTAYRENLSRVLGRHSEEPSFRGFFSPSLFADVASYIGKPKDSYRVASIGMHPSIAQFNGFYTLDAYQTNYLLEYKQKFRKVIARELAKNAELAEYFDQWGNRCYVFVAELGRGYPARPIRDLEIDADALKALGGQYVFSTNEILMPEKSGLMLEKAFSSDEGPRIVYLYHVK